MFKDTQSIINRIKKDTNNSEDIYFREKIINNNKLYIICSDSMSSGERISSFILKSLNKISLYNGISIKEEIINNITNLKVMEVKDYKELCLLLHSGFAIILIEGEDVALSFETKGDISRSIPEANTEKTVRGSKDAFLEDYYKNIGLIKKRIKSNNLWAKQLSIGKYTDTKVGIIYINGIVDKKLVNIVESKIKKIDIDGVINSSAIKNLIEDESRSVFPTIHTTERPDIACEELLEGKIIIIVDNSPYVLILPALLNDFFKSADDFYSKSKNVTFTRSLRWIAFFISLLVPAIFIALVTYNQEMVPTNLLISFATQRDGVPFPAFFEAFIMIFAYEILREGDLRVPTFTGSSLSIVGALILGDAAVSAGLVSPITIIIIAITSISALAFSEVELINGLRWYRFLFMIGASLLGIVGIVIMFIYFIINMSSLESFGKPYLMPYVPTNKEGLKDSFIKFPLKNLIKRESYLSHNVIKQGVINDENN